LKLHVSLCLHGAQSDEGIENKYALARRGQPACHDYSHAKMTSASLPPHASPVSIRPARPEPADLHLPF